MFFFEAYGLILTDTNIILPILNKFTLEISD